LFVVKKVVPLQTYLFRIMLNKLFLYIILSASAVHFAYSEDTIPSIIIFENTEGQKTEISITGSEVNIFNGVFTVVSSAEEEFTFNFTDINSFYFKKDESGTRNNEIKTDAAKIYFDDAENLKISAGSSIGKVDVFSITGQKLKSVVVQSNEALIPASDLKGGIYLIKTDLGTFKLLKR